ncbi:N-acetyl sugar amidotransferase [Thalassolituus sp. LLYu03]|uniref:N-acetyl sugar amidotransferase n=1 Tax=Thalassolituus sp. LLYu03 TaxID=3421656 RepID=UPI003D2DD387
MTPLVCKRCLYTSDHPLGVYIDDQGICSGCRIHEEKDSLDWAFRWSRLEKLVKPYRSTDRRNYDCIVPVSGGQDSYFILHIVKERLKLNPLLVTYNKYWNTPVGIRNLANLRIRFNCDILIQNVNPVSVKKIVKETIRQLGSIYWHCIAGQTVFPVQTAVRYKIPLIIWGAHQGVEQVGMFSHEHEVEMTRRYRKEHDLMGQEADDLVTHFNTLTESDIWQYRYPDDGALNEVGVRGIYLGNFIRWDPLAQHRQMVDMHDYQAARFTRTFDIYDYVDCFNYMNIHDRIKIKKHGFSKVTDHACREIRHGRLSREHAVDLVRYYEMQPSLSDSMFFDWLGVDSRSFDFSLDSVCGHDIDFKSEGCMSDFYPEANDSLGVFDQNSGYITIGKGWPV